MRKLFRKLIGFVIVIVIAASLYVGYLGYQKYVEVTSLRSLQEVTEPYFMMEDYATYEELDEDLIHAVISVEDKRFFTRKGYDWIALLRAIIENLQAQKLAEGASTITEQIAKNLYFGFQTNSLEEKMARIFIIYDLEESYSKEELFALYVNMNYYGDGYYGIRAASQGYFGVDCSDLSLAQSALLAGIPNAPSIYQLSTGYHLAKERANKVLQTMLKNEMIDESQYQQALMEIDYTE